MTESTFRIMSGSLDKAFHQGISDADELARTLQGRTPGVITPDEWAFAVGRSLALRFGEDSGSDEAVTYVQAMMLRAPVSYRVRMDSPGDATFEMSGQVTVRVVIDPDDEDVKPSIAITALYHDEPDDQPHVQVNGEEVW
jgi:hypothetical protein